MRATPLYPIYENTSRPYFQIMFSEGREYIFDLVLLVNKTLLQKQRKTNTLVKISVCSAYFVTDVVLCRDIRFRLLFESQQHFFCFC